MATDQRYDLMRSHGGHEYGLRQRGGVFSLPRSLSQVRTVGRRGAGDCQRPRGGPTWRRAVLPLLHLHEVAVAVSHSLPRFISSLFWRCEIRVDRGRWSK